ncbi:helix-turn-helix domain-containing protein [Pimelobacter simplex]|uniref:PucR family transcriptional regulator n=1 Tax=Nocardioides simplex TaxID=2045 RepID=UPI00214FF68E|nr:helix-turn-helix domain-containing protein [Pimelobacter simplex]UUW92043.1 helix-turn-helix domain-containing protein [Pimelobacter simplex]UUW95870.1 helix-turn-helix domain-containing protein [Pimelobacter simplex]
MTEAPARVSLPGSAQWMISSLEGQVREVAERVTLQVRTTVPDIDGGGDSRLRQLVFTAIHNAMRLFVDEALGREVSYVAVEDMFRKVGYRVAIRGRDQDVIDQGMNVAVRELSTELRVRAAENELSAGALNAINEAVTIFVAHLTEQITIGWRAGAEARNTDSGLARARLLAALLSGADDDEVETQAAIAGWEVPDRLTVIAVELPEGRTMPGDALGDEALTRPSRTPQPVVCGVDDADEVVARIRATFPQARAAVCWPVPRSDVPAAWTWANRAQELVRAKVIPTRPVIDCVRFRTEIWLHAEPVLRRQLAQELLQPLFNETENSREILSETLLVWLETRDSAPAIAAKLGVHPQTVRYRWKRINELFGDSLHDPDFVIQLTLLLKASVPLWIAGDQSDFERFREQEEAG